MSKFNIYNIQLLPNDGAPEVGSAGYRKLFSKLRDLNQKHLRQKTHLNYHFHVSGDMYIGPLDFKFPAGHVTGHFVRYRNTETVTELATGKTLYSAKDGKAGVTNQRVVPFVFDSKRHFFAIDRQLIIRSQDFIDALDQLLRPIAEENFPDHELTVNLISKPNVLENVFRTAVSYKTVRIHLNGPNGSDALDVLGEMRDSQMQKLELDASGGNGRMSRLPEFVKKILRSVPGHGWSTVTYFVHEGEPGDLRERKQTYDSREQPQTFTVRHSSKDGSEDDFLDRVAAKLQEVDLSAEEEEGESDDDSQ